jgi:nicotinate-nucleotide adenylyltransferase
MHLAILGGSFNPIQLGHIVLAQSALSHADQVLFMPLGNPAHREMNDPGKEIRYSMVQAAIQNLPGLEVSRLEIDSLEKSYTFNTLKKLQQKFPNDKLSWIIGADQAIKFADWYKGEEILKLASLLVADRTNISRASILESFPYSLDRLHFFEMPLVDISSTVVRERIKQGANINHMVPLGVSKKIYQEGLYQEELQEKY